MREDKEQKEIRQMTKEIVVKFIEMGKITPTSFPQLFPMVHSVVKSTLKDDDAQEPLEDISPTKI